MLLSASDEVFPALPEVFSFFLEVFPVFSEVFSVLPKEVSSVFSAVFPDVLASSCDILSFGKGYLACLHFLGVSRYPRVGAGKRELARSVIFSYAFRCSFPSSEDGCERTTLLCGAPGWRSPVVVQKRMRNNA